MKEYVWLLGAGGVTTLTAGGIWLYLRTRKSPEERERLRRMQINQRGRIADGNLVEIMDHDGRHLLVYEYSVAQVTYNAAQDISALAENMRLSDLCDGLPARVKYDPHNPGDSIVVCEQWSGL